jgi:hypothetical protein
MQIRTVAVRRGKSKKERALASLLESILHPKEIIVYKTIDSGWQKLFVGQGEPTVIPDDAVRRSICFFRADQKAEALAYWRQMEEALEHWESAVDASVKDMIPRPGRSR